MTDETLAEILSGVHEPTSREDLHAMLDDLLDAADADGGRLDGPAFWTFVASVARGRGIADEIADDAAKYIAEASGVSEIPKDDPAGAAAAEQALFRMWLWAVLAALLRRVTAFPGRIVPSDFPSIAFLMVADNVITGRGRKGAGPHMDLLGLGTQKGADWKAEARAARRILVGVVYFRAEQTGQSVAKARADMLPDLPDRTWKDWVREAARVKRVPVQKVGEEARAAARGKGNPFFYMLGGADVASLWKVAQRGLPKKPKGGWGGKAG